MIDFRKIILSSINESDNLTTSPADSVFRRVLAPTDAFRKIYSKAGYPTYNDETVTGIITLFRRNWTRQSDKSFTPYAKFFTLMDFLAFVYVTLLKGTSTRTPHEEDFTKSINDDDYDHAVGEFFKQIGGEEYLHHDPLLNKAASGFGGILKRALDKAAANALGKEVFDKPDFQKMSILKAVYALIHARKINREQVLRLDKIPEPGDEIKNILLHATSLGGLRTVPASTFKSYKEDFLRDLQNIGYAASKLWEQQKEVYNASSTPNTFEQFLKNEPLNAFKQEIAESTETVLETLGSEFYGLNKELENATKIMSQPEFKDWMGFGKSQNAKPISSPNPTASAAVPSTLSKSTQSSSAEQPSDRKKPPIMGTVYDFKVRSKTTPAGTILANKVNNPGDGGYTIENLQHMSSTNPPAEKLLEHLYAFAEYVHLGEPEDTKIKAASSLFQDLGNLGRAFSFGVD